MAVNADLGGQFDPYSVEVRLESDGPGIFPDLAAALRYLTLVGITVSTTRPFYIFFGPGTHMVVAGTTIPSSVILKGSGITSTILDFGGATSNGFTTGAAEFSDLTFSNLVGFAVSHSSTGLTRLNRIEISATCTALITHSVSSGVSYSICDTCSGAFATNFFQQTAGSATAGIIAVNCNPAIAGTYADVDAGPAVFRNCAFSSAAGTGIGFDISGGTVDSAFNNITAVNKGILLSGSGTIKSQSDRVTVTGASPLAFEISGVWTGTHEFSNFKCDITKLSIGIYAPPADINDINSDCSFTKQKITTITGNTTLDYQYKVVLCNSASDFTVTMPPAAAYANWVYIIKNINTGIVTIDANASELIDGQLTQAIAVQWGFAKIISNGTAWYSI